VQEEIADAVARALRVRLLPGRIPSARERRTSSPSAYDHYLLGRTLLLGGTPEGARRAAEELEKVVALDPSYAPAYANLAIALHDIGGDMQDPVAARAYRRKALATADRAVSVGPDLPEAYAARGLLRHLQRDWSGARDDLERAVRLGPGDPVAHRRLAIFLAGQGRFEDAVTAAGRAIELDPLGHLHWRWLGVIQASMGKTGIALDSVRRALELMPTSQWIRGELAQDEVLDGHAAEALEQLPYLTELDRLYVTALAQHDLGHDDEARRALGDIVARFSFREAGRVADVYAHWRDRDRAFEWLERGLREGQEIDLNLDPFLRDLRADARWNDLLRKAGLPSDVARQ